ncbi:DUF3037 domain-containing protein [Flavobacterium cerinum]|uniref:DUF3037 domain-containing protein n=1 Tax=Flavobacterium cerinum TaxID=2502784 RepID=A0ABY5IQA6_9FLAO|nr:DUF3037 domain-containing protein [Flavobacterium cerinum]UUC44965.1 DUF3037 domain-containing protein [Flavobacterium cerinum]
MQDKHLYEYAVIRVLPRVEREEFLNVGIILFSKSAKYIKVRYAINEQKLLMFSDDLDIEQLQLNLESFEKIAHGDKNGGPIAQLDIPSRFRWLTAVRSSVIQTSRPHPGFCGNLDGTIERLFTELVL